MTSETTSPPGSLNLTVLSQSLCICRLDASASVPVQVYQAPFYSITRTADELSVICDETYCPPGHPCNRGWRCLKVEGPLDFSETGIMAGLTRPLAQAKIAIIAISTYETDYLLVKEQDLPRTMEMLILNGHVVG